MSRKHFRSSHLGRTKLLLSLIMGGIATAAVLAVGACAAHGRMAIPGNADRIASGEGRDALSVSTARSGKVHVLDRDDNSVVWAGEVHADDKIVIDGNDHKITLNGATVAEGIHGDHHYVVFLSHPD